MINTDLPDLLRALTVDLIAIFGDNLNSLILFGSYARGDFDEESDIDLLCILREPMTMHKDIRKNLAAIAVKYSQECDILPSVRLIHQKKYDEDKAYNMLYRNVEMEGVRLYAQ